MTFQELTQPANVEPGVVIEGIEMLAAEGKHAEKSCRACVELAPVLDDPVALHEDHRQAPDAEDMRHDPA
ncbi:MAG: hypothetical protein AW09_002093 [Candidatus Accumulibacter phosphatis]|uniref:Uncharacterized protein n=1 Tax=Candidatus Accumulibacter phosphatis TaxID=327160 RepID=A0A080LXY0_9PROT|nr:MAG: hypothetical protein AW09_002093 [Candidatus Accumulibacter phosphatis]